MVHFQRQTIIFMLEIGSALIVCHNPLFAERYSSLLQSEILPVQHSQFLSQSRVRFSMLRWIYSLAIKLGLSLVTKGLLTWKGRIAWCSGNQYVQFQVLVAIHHGPDAIVS